MQQKNQEFNTTLVSGKALFEKLQTSFFRNAGNLTQEAVAVFHELPGALLDLLQTQQVRAYHQESDVFFRGVFTCRKASNDAVSHVMYRVNDLRLAFSNAIDLISPQMNATLMAEFDRYASQVSSRSKVPQDLGRLNGYGVGLARLKHEDESAPTVRSFAASQKGITYPRDPRSTRAI